MVGQTLWTSTFVCQRFTQRPRAAIVEQVRDGSNIRVRLLLEDGSHQFINLVSAAPTGLG